MQIEEIVDLVRHPLKDEAFKSRCKSSLDADGVLVLPGFISSDALETICAEGRAHQKLAYYTRDSHNIYLSPKDPSFPDHHPRNRLVISSKGCITDDQIPASSPLKVLYSAPVFLDFLCAVLGEKGLYEYADALSSINLHYADAGKELGWHFDNSSFAVTLLIQKPVAGGEFEYVKDVRNADAGDMNYAMAEKILNGEVATTRLSIEAGDLVLFRGRNSMHRVTPTIGEVTRMLTVLAYNSQPGVALSESARMTFYGRL